ncbi:hypothetical protein BVRB_4g092890 [Beta vulgaris subsp. vulgaris]|uniref:uncharacterized protein LOC104907193 isoform X1 n=1 Tax=Beta vulgaris subsp. vulgaris TaxID=3555 RepID=UPI00054035EE|nr:uncharacterized protein LOC104907193 isoform X1 [Beta vulgaris subsp. vulgaris]KMS98410.1 hypothetical protein BVRB_4g092890 [Beta vulgaris subsp. vulgaris]
MASATLNGVSMNGFASSLVCYLPNFHAFPRISTFSSSCFYSSSSGPGMYKVHHLLRASSEELSSELVEDSKFVPLEAEDPSYGPPAILLLGFQVEEADKIQQLLKDLDGEFLQVIYCTEDMITRSLWDAVNSGQQDLGKLRIAKSVPRICFLSGLSGEEMMMFIDSFEETGLEPAVFAAHVPNSSDKSLLELTEEIMGDHEMLSAKQSDPK